jgi:hypothetical protein
MAGVPVLAVAFNRVPGTGVPMVRAGAVAHSLLDVLTDTLKFQLFMLEPVPPVVVYTRKR